METTDPEEDNVSNAVTHQFRLHPSFEREFASTIYCTLY